MSMRMSFFAEIDRDTENAIESFLRQFQSDYSREEDFCVRTFIEQCLWLGGLEDMIERVEKHAGRSISMRWRAST